MSDSERIAIAAVLVITDVLLFAVPLTGIFAAYVLIARPRWFLEWVDQLYHGTKKPG